MANEWDPIEERGNWTLITSVHYYIRRLTKYVIWTSVGGKRNESTGVSVRRHLGKVDDREEMIMVLCMYGILQNKIAL